jgi:predicted nucleotidyltransferase component of viral defense system
MSIRPLPVGAIELLDSKFKIDPSFTEKDWYTQHILGVIAKFESDEFQPVFSGGTSLSKGYRLIQRFSEDVDFRMRPLKDKLTRSFRSNYQDRIVEAVLNSSADLQLVRDVYKRDKSTFLKFQVAYPSQFSSVDALRPYVQVELSFEPPQLETETCQVSSLIHQFTQQPPEIPSMACLNLSETAADKLGALSWRVMGKEPSDAKYDPRIIRHLYDLSYLAPRVIDSPDWLDLSYKTVANDLKTRDRSLAERIKDPIELLTGLTEKLSTNKAYARHYQDFVESLAYGESPSFKEAIESLGQLTDRLQQQSKEIRSTNNNVDGVSTTEEPYHPSVGKLLQWHGAANIVQDETAKQLVLGLGRRLKDEFEAAGVGGVAPRDYSSPSVAVSEDVWQQMEKMATVARSVPFFDPEVTIEFDVEITTEQTKKTGRGR